jgi:hypothetical protein
MHPQVIIPAEALFTMLTAHQEMDRGGGNRHPLIQDHRQTGTILPEDQTTALILASQGEIHQQQ